MRFAVIALLTVLGLTGCYVGYGEIPSNLFDVYAVDPTLIDVQTTDLDARLLQRNFTVELQILDGADTDIWVLKSYQFQLSVDHVNLAGETRLNAVPSIEDPSVTLSGNLYISPGAGGSKDWVSGRFTLDKNGSTALILTIEGYL